MIKDKITPQLRKRFLEEIKISKDTEKERGFYLCVEDNGKLSAGNICTGDECSIMIKNPEISCGTKVAQGDFHTHPYLPEIKKQFGIKFKASNELIKAATEIFLEDRRITPTTPSHGDVLTTILGKCAKKINGSVCIGSDLDKKNVECWTITKIDEGDCIKALIDQTSVEKEKAKHPEEWVEPLFEKEIINLKK